MNPDLAIMAVDMYLCLQEMKLAEEHVHNHMKPRLGIASNDYKDRSWALVCLVRAMLVECMCKKSAAAQSWARNLRCY